MPLLRLRRRVSGRGTSRLRRSIETCGRSTPGAGHGATRRHRNLDAAHADPHERADLQQFETDGAAAGLRKWRMIQPNSAHRTHQHVGHRSKPQPQLICPHAGRRGAIRIEVELALLDAIFHVTARAVDFFVKILALHSDLFSEVTTKRGLASPAVNSALPTTRRSRLQLSSVVHRKSLKQRAGLPVRRLFASALAISLEIFAIKLGAPSDPEQLFQLIPSNLYRLIPSSRSD